MEIQKTALRLPKDLHQQVIEAAQNSGHSMNAEIIARLRLSFESVASPSEAKIREIIREELNRKK